MDRNLGSHKLAEQLRSAGFDITVHDDLYEQTERDPWIFYDRGCHGHIIITADREFMKHFPHMAAIDLGRTKVIAFTNNNFNSEVRGAAFIKAGRKIFSAIVKSRDAPFIGVVGMDGSFKVVDDAPRPSRIQCDARDWASYGRVCAAAGPLHSVQAETETD